MNSLLNRMTIPAKVVCSFGMIMLLVLTLGIVAINRLAAINDQAANMRDNWLPSTGMQGKLLGAVEDVRESELLYLLADTDQQRRLTAADVVDHLDAVNRLRSQYDSLITAGTDDVKFMQDFDRAWANHQRAARKYFDGNQTSQRDVVPETIQKSFLDAVAAVRSDLEFNVAAGKQTADASAAIYATTKLIVITAILAVLGACLLLGFAIATSVATPIRQMTQTMTRLAADDLTVVIEGQDRRDEIGAMANAVQVFKQSIQTARQLARDQQIERDLKQKGAARLEHAVASFEVTASEMVGLLSAGSTELEATARAMSGSADSTNRQANAVAVAAEQAGDAIHTVAAAASELSTSIGEISGQVAKSAKMAVQAVNDARRTNAIVAALAEGASKIGDVVGLITSIAGQTNLLALNATIEAARAGDAGKGFAVVASEVKNLAAQTGRATEEIGAQISQIQTATTEAVAAIRGISASIEEVSAIATTIAAAVEEQGAATAEIARSVQQTASATQDVTANISGVGQSANDSSDAASQVLTAAGDLSSQAARLSNEVKTFVSNVRAA